MATVTVTQANVVAIAPELASVDAGEFTAQIAAAASRLNATAWNADNDNGVFWNEGIKWLAAHLISVAHPDLGKTDRLPTYEKVAGAGGYNDTRFGVQFWQLQKRVVLRFMVI